MVCGVPSDGASPDGESPDDEPAGEGALDGGDGGDVVPPGGFGVRCAARGLFGDLSVGGVTCLDGVPVDGPCWP